MSTTIGSTAPEGTAQHVGHTEGLRAGADHLGRITVLSLSAGAVAAAILVLVVFAGAAEAVITGAGLLGFAVGWALLAAMSTRRTARPQGWAAVPAGVMAATGSALILLAPGDSTLTSSGWVWGPVMLTLAVWCAVQARRTLDTAARMVGAAHAGAARLGLDRGRRPDGPRDPGRRRLPPAWAPRGRRGARDAPGLQRHRQPHRLSLIHISEPHETDSYLVCRLLLEKKK